MISWTRTLLPEHIIILWFNSSAATRAKSIFICTHKRNPVIYVTFHFFLSTSIYACVGVRPPTSGLIYIHIIVFVCMRAFQLQLQFIFLVVFICTRLLLHAVLLFDSLIQPPMPSSYPPTSWLCSPLSMNI